VLERGFLARILLQTDSEMMNRHSSAVVLIAVMVTAGCSAGTAGPSTTASVVSADEREAGPITTGPSTTVPMTSTTADSTTTASRPATTTLPSEPAAIVLHGGAVLTMEPGRGAAAAIALDGDRIVAVGTAAEVLSRVGPETVVVDLEGRAVLPGLIDAHSHWISDDHLMGIDDAETAAHLAAERGITTIYDTFVRPDDLSELIGLDERGALPVRVSAYFPVNFLTRDYGIWFGEFERGDKLSPNVRVAGAKLFMDPTDPASMFLTEPHADRPGFHGDVVWSQADLDAMVAELDAAGYQIAVHAGGDGALDMILDAFDAALSGRPNDLRHRVEHLPVVRDDQLVRLRELGIVASIQTTWFHSDWIGHGSWGGFPRALGPERIAWAGRWRDLLDAGVTVIGGTDAPWTPSVSVGGFAEAVTRLGASGIPPESWMLAQRITVPEAVALQTAAAAFGGFEEEVKGTLTPGKYADLIIVSANPFEIAPEALFDLEVLATIIGGEIVFCADEIPGLCP
jgi:predicted amidohydrolase YtcJ